MPVNYTDEQIEKIARQLNKWDIYPVPKYINTSRAKEFYDLIYSDIEAEIRQELLMEIEGLTEEEYNNGEFFRTISEADWQNIRNKVLGGSNAKS